MYINPAWRILTIGDGDLSFSASIVKNYQPAHLTATILDNKETLIAKYGDEYYSQLLAADCDVLLSFDVTNKASWGSIKLHDFDVVIFQFPLVPAFISVDDFQQQQNNDVSVNTINRYLLRTYLLNCFQYFLSPSGENLAFITSKNVKPYQQWNIETSVIIDTDIQYLGRVNFAIENFSGYKVRNVDHDKHVKSTASYSYIYSNKINHQLCREISQTLDVSEVKLVVNDTTGQSCRLCRTGVFTNQLDKETHFASKKHATMLKFEQQWLVYLSSR